MAKRSRAKVKVKKVTFYRASTWGHEETITPDALRYDLAFVNDEDPTLIAFVVFSNGYGSKFPTFEMWRSHGHRLALVRDDLSIDEGTKGRDKAGRELRNRYELRQIEDSVKRGDEGWKTFRHPRDASGRPQYGELKPASLSLFLDLHPSDHPSAVETSLA